MAGDQDGSYLAVVHCGAGYHSPSSESKYKALLKRACNAANDALKSNCDALVAVEKALRILEADELLNAGYGSNLTIDGKVECDASIAVLLPGCHLQYAAIACASLIRFPISAAIELLRNSLLPLGNGREQPIFLAGTGADQFAKQHNVDMVLNNDELISPSARSRHTKYLSKIRKDVKQDDDDRGDTVGAICIDKNGAVAVGSSSGGIALKHPGRIGQAACVGAGSYIERDKDLYAACATGTGEHILKTFLAQACVRAVASESSTAISEVFRHCRKQVSDFAAGIVMVEGSSPHFQIIAAHTTPSMCFASSLNGQRIHFVMSRKEESRPFKCIVDPA